MVFKVSKGGVRTGNTLRGLHSTRTKRYGRHSCLLGCTSLGRRDLSRLINDSSDDEQLVKETLGKTNVLLSLNKQQRWRLPAIISRKIKDGDFNKGAVVSMLEKHKLKRKANCVSLVSNNSRNANIVPKQKKYFSFSLDSFTNEMSNREKRRVHAEEMKKLQIPKQNMQNRNNNKHKTIKTYTTDGSPRSNAPVVTDNERPEYRLEVFYPCPQSCSLTYNPKYTDVVVAEGKTGKMEVKSNVKNHKKGQSTHRKRLTSRDIDLMHNEAVEYDVGEMWEESYDDNKDEENAREPSERCSMESSIEMLVAQAKKTRELCIRKKDSCHSKNKKRSKLSFTDVEEVKSHIVFIDREEEEQNAVSVSETASLDTSLDTVDDNVPSLETFRVVLTTSEIASEKLKRTYGSLYAEASCLPRRFVLDVTEDVTNLLSTSKGTVCNVDFTSYLVCVHDGFYDDGLMAYKVAFNSMIGHKMQGLSEIIPFAKTSIPDVMNAVISHLLDLKEQNQLEFNVKKNSKGKAMDDADFLNSRIKLKVDVIDPADEISRVFISDDTEIDTQVTTQSDVSDTLAVDLDEDLFCDVCYASVTSSRIDSASGTKLKACGHLLCDECWACHFRSCMKGGKTKMSCGGYDCGTVVGPVTLMSILNVSEVALLLQRQTEERLETMENAKWCPFPGCGRVIKIDSKSKDLCVDVICACGNKLCFSCFGPSHWPARCEQAEEYFEKLPNIQPAKEYVEEHTKPRPLPEVKRKNKPVVMMIEGRLCPLCNKFIEKNGGCSHMVCRCGYQMCWQCMRSIHDGQCRPDHNYVIKYTRTLIVKHVAAKRLVAPNTTEEELRPKIVKNKQKASMCQRALQQREEGTSYGRSNNMALVQKMIKKANQDSEFKMEILKSFSVNVQPEDETSLEKVNVAAYVKKLIQASVEMKKELHHVTEFTFILLQDTPHSVAKQRILKLANDLSGFCSFVRSILDLQDTQDAKAAFRRLVDLQGWAKRALDALIRDTNKLRAE